mmetsp:Transcript_19055/g.30238  ORF Transcript_19055/g.30238 Transcript_19055/m.30238 type:complete len:318 (-) Transcript_19055:93-1046(-)
MKFQPWSMAGGQQAITRNNSLSSLKYAAADIDMEVMKNVTCSVTTNLCSLERWKLEASLLWRQKLIFCVCVAMHFAHAPATNLAYYRHLQGERLRDAGFELVPLITPQLAVLSEILFFFILCSTVCAAFVPFLHKRPRVHFTTMLIRCLLVMACCIVLRCATFLSTSLPGPAPHCQPGSEQYNPPHSLSEVLARIDIFKGCGDLIFSSHTALSLCLTCSVYVYLPLLLPISLFRLWFFCVLLPAQILLLILIIAARKHYTVDVVVACYTTPLLYYASYYFYTDQPRPDETEIAQSQDREDRASEQVRLLIFPKTSND